MLYLEKTRQPDVKSSKVPNISGEVFGTLINLSGRRRFTSQRVVFAVLASQGCDGALQMADDALTAFRDAHAALVAGTDQVPGIFCDELQEAYFGAAQGDLIIRDFIGLARRALDAIASRSPGAPPLLERLVESATPLLAALNGINQIYDDLARRQAALARKQMTAVMSDIESITKHAHIDLAGDPRQLARHELPARGPGAGCDDLGIERDDELVREALRASVA
jgi:hypothetical protein